LNKRNKKYSPITANGGVSFAKAGGNLRWTILALPIAVEKA